jgi:hypothetical protein
MFFLSLIISICFSLSTVQANAESKSEIHLAIEGKYKPYYIGNGGIEVDIARAAFKESKLRINVQRFPLERLRVAIQKHGMDAALSAIQEEKDGFFVSPVAR